jgi:8-oxo-dGTP diphosphatase
MLRVVSGALIRNGYVLMGLRKKDGLRPDLWELPGGKVDAGEDPRAALVREWREECDCAVRVDKFISMAMLHVDISFVIELYTIELAAMSKPPHALDHQELRWVNPLYAVRSMPCSPAFYLHYAQLVQHIEANWPPSVCDVVSDSGCSHNECPRCHPFARPVLALGEL